MMTDIENNKERFLDIVNKYIKRDGIENLVSYLERSDFFTAPASTRFHECYDGGLVEHSLNVYDQLKKLIDCYKLDVSEETIAIVSLFHDLCKIDCYEKEVRWKKDENNQWESYDSYKFEEKKKFGGHGSKSVFITQFYIKLTFEEATAINCHMGPNGTDFSCMDAYRDYPLAFLLHVADMASTIDTL
jgi:hypothetical protein